MDLIDICTHALNRLKQGEGNWLVFIFSFYKGYTPGVQWCGKKTSWGSQGTGQDADKEKIIIMYQWAKKGMKNRDRIEQKVAVKVLRTRCKIFTKEWWWNKWTYI